MVHVSGSSRKTWGEVENPLNPLLLCFRTDWVTAQDSLDFLLTLQSVLLLLLSQYLSCSRNGCHHCCLINTYFYQILFNFETCLSAGPTLNMKTERSLGKYARIQPPALKASQDIANKSFNVEQLEFLIAMGEITFHWDPDVKALLHAWLWAQWSLFKLPRQPKAIKLFWGSEGLGMPRC